MSTKVIRRVTSTWRLDREMICVLRWSVHSSFDRCAKKFRRNSNTSLIFSQSWDGSRKPSFLGVVFWLCSQNHQNKIKLISNRHAYTTAQTSTMALSRFNSNTFGPFFGFHELFAPSPFMTRDPFEDWMPVIRNVDRTFKDMTLRHSPGFEINENDDKREIRRNA